MSAHPVFRKKRFDRIAVDSNNSADPVTDQMAIGYQGANHVRSDAEPLSGFSGRDQIGGFGFCLHFCHCHNERLSSAQAFRWCGRTERQWRARLVGRAAEALYEYDISMIRDMREIMRDSTKCAIVAHHAKAEGARWCVAGRRARGPLAGADWGRCWPQDRRAVSRAAGQRGGWRATGSAAPANRIGHRKRVRHG